MGFKECVLLNRALGDIKNVDPSIKDDIKSILLLVQKANCFNTYKRKIYRLISQICKNRLVKDTVKFDNAIDALKEIDFLLPEALYRNRTYLEPIIKFIEEEHSTMEWQEFYVSNPEITAELILSIKNKVMQEQMFNVRKNASHLKKLMDSQVSELREEDYQ